MCGVLHLSSEISSEKNCYIINIGKVQHHLRYHPGISYTFPVTIHMLCHSSIGINQLSERYLYLSVVATVDRGQHVMSLRNGMNGNKHNVPIILCCYVLFCESS